MDNVVTSSLVFEGNGVISPYVGGYQDWLRQRPKIAADKNAGQRIKKIALAEAPKPVKKKLSYKLQQELDNLPKRLEVAEAAVQTLQISVSGSDFYQGEQAQVTKTMAQLAAAQQTVEQLMERWLELDE